MYICIYIYMYIYIYKYTYIHMCYHRFFTCCGKKALRRCVHVAVMLQLPTLDDGTGREMSRRFVTRCLSDLFLGEWVAPCLGYTWLQELSRLF